MKHKYENNGHATLNNESISLGQTNIENAPLLTDTSFNLMCSSQIVSPDGAQSIINDSNNDSPLSLQLKLFVKRHAFL